MDDDRLCRLVILGDYYSQKTKLRCKILNQQYKVEKSAIVGIQFGRKEINYKSNTTTVEFWDTSEQARYLSSTTVALNKADGLIYVYEASSEQSFSQMVLNLQDINKRGFSSKKKMIVGYVIDPMKRVIHKERGMKFAANNNLMFQEVQHSDSEQTLDNIIGKFIEEIIFQERMEKIEEQYLFLLSNAKNQQMSSVAVGKIYNLFSLLKEKYRVLEQKGEESAQREKMIKTELQMLESQIQLYRMKRQQMQGKIKGYQKLAKKIQAYDVRNIYEMANLFETDNLRTKEQLKEMERQLIKREGIWKKRCQSLEILCQEIEGITIHNATSKLNKISEDYHNYRLLNCTEESIAVFQEELSETGRMSFLLQGWNRSSILEYQ